MEASVKPMTLAISLLASPAVAHPSTTAANRGVAAAIHQSLYAFFCCCFFATATMISGGTFLWVSNTLCCGSILCLPQRVTQLMCGKGGDPFFRL